MGLLRDPLNMGNLLFARSLRIGSFLNFNQNMIIQAQPFVVAVQRNCRIFSCRNAMINLLDA